MSRQHAKNRKAVTVAIEVLRDRTANLRQRMDARKVLQDFGDQAADADVLQQKIMQLEARVAHLQAELNYLVRGADDPLGSP